MSAAGLLIVGAAVTLIVAAALALLIYAAVLDGRDALRTVPAAPGAGTQNLVEVARAAGLFTTLVAAIDRAGMSEALAHEGPYTVFAPSDLAFSRLPEGTVESLLAAPETLAEVLNYHLVPGRMRAADVALRHCAETLHGEDLALSNHGAIRVDGARVIAGDIEASNGVIHMIDRVLLPARI